MVIICMLIDKEKLVENFRPSVADQDSLLVENEEKNRDKQIEDTVAEYWQFGWFA